MEHYDCSEEKEVMLTDVEALRGKFTYTIDDFCRIMQIRKETWYKWEQKQGGTPKTFKLGRRVLITRDDLNDWFKKTGAPLSV